MLTGQELETFLDKLVLMKGSHLPDGVFCAMEAAAFIAGEKWSDAPQCVSPVIAAFMRSWNDSLDDSKRQMLKPYIVKSLNTASDEFDEATRAWMLTDWLARECAPAFLRLAGLTTHAETLEGLVALTGERDALDAQPKLAAAGEAARAAAWEAARAAEGTAREPAVAAIRGAADPHLDGTKVEE